MCLLEHQVNNTLVVELLHSNTNKESLIDYLVSLYRLASFDVI